MRTDSLGVPKLDNIGMIISLKEGNVGCLVYWQKPTANNVRRRAVAFSQLIKVEKDKHGRKVLTEVDSKGNIGEVIQWAHLAREI